MLQYILNASAIWLLSLLVFDIFLRRENFHSYNRVYLLGTLLIGAMLPLWQWRDAIMPYMPGDDTLDRVLDAKRAIVDNSVAATTDMGGFNWLVAAYFIGVAVAIALLVIDIAKLATYYGGGKVTMQHGWQITETGKGHAPFSFRNTLFVNSIAQYSAEEWTMILQHERRHTSLWHIADIMLLQAARIVFWFHPLVYIYQWRTQQVHEYQADSASAQQPGVYGRFLVEQSMLQSAPNIAHSFNRSPIKNRIVMLTRRSNSFSRIKMLIVAPLAATCLLCFCKNSFSYEYKKDGRTVTYNGYKITLSDVTTDTLELEDPVTGAHTFKYIQRAGRPVTLNGKKIYTAADYAAANVKSGTAASFKAGLTTDRLKTYLLSSMAGEFNDLPDGQYDMYVVDVLLNEKGRIVYYKNASVTVADDHDPRSLRIPAPVQEKLRARVIELLDDAPGFSAATFNGESVPYIMEGIPFGQPFTLKDHKVIAE